MPTRGTNTIRRTIQILVVFAVVGATFAGLRLLAASQCASPKTWSVGRVDPQFDLSKEMVAQYGKESTAVWNEAHPTSPLFTYEETGGSITLNFVYDERMQTTLRNQRLKRTINQGKQQLNTIKDTLSSLQAQYADAGATIDYLTKNYNTDLAVYNKEVSYWNSQGGAPADIYAQLQTRKQNLETERLSLNAKINRYNQLGEEIRTYGQDHNQIVSSINQQISTLNESAGQEFEEGVYDPNTNSITVYEYASPTSLKRVLIHEFGHSLGLGHVEGQNSIMYAVNEGVNLNLSKEDLTALNAVCSESKLSAVFQASADTINAIRGGIFHLVGSSWPGIAAPQG